MRSQDGESSAVHDVRVPKPIDEGVPAVSADCLCPHPGPIEDSLILPELRKKTAMHHAALEDAVDIFAALRSTLAYGNLLTNFLGLYSVLEPRVLAAPNLAEWLPDFSQRARTPLLLADLRALNLPATRIQRCNYVPGINDAATAFGCLYVLEGSTLGGQVITRQAHASLGVTAENGCAFFSSAGRDIGKMWRTFGASLEAFARKNPGSRLRVTENAIATFELFRRWFSTRMP